VIKYPICFRKFDAKDGSYKIRIKVFNSANTEGGFVMATNVHLVEPGFYPEDIKDSHFFSYAANGGFEGGLANQGEKIGVPEEVLQQFADEVNAAFELRTMKDYPVTMFPAELVRGHNADSPLKPVAIIEMMIELWRLRMGNKMPRTVVFVISNMWNPDITGLHQKWASEGCNLRGVRDLYVWTI
jgi:hypothetical protein